MYKKHKFGQDFEKYDEQAAAGVGLSTGDGKADKSSVFADGFNRPRTASRPACSPARATSTSPASPTCTC